MPTNERHLTNTSGRKYLVQKLKASGVQETEIIHVTGHKDTRSLKSYSELSTQQARGISSLLHHPKQSSSLVPRATPHPNLIYPAPGTSTSQSTVVSSQQNTACSSNPGLSALFAGSTITGGTFNITVNNNNTSQSQLRQKLSTPVIDSDDSQ